MNTPAHAVVNLLALGRRSGHPLAVTAGAVAPDLSMVVFYIQQRVLLGRPERLIWTVGYQDPAWQMVFDAAHSLPLLLLLLALARWRAAPRAAAFFASTLST